MEKLGKSKFTFWNEQFKIIRCQNIMQIVQLPWSIQQERSVSLIREFFFRMDTKRFELSFHMIQVTRPAII